MMKKTFVDVSRALRAQARKLGLCDEWYASWKDATSYEMLIDMMKEGYDFCVDHDWPSPDYVVKNFPRTVLRDNGVFCNDKGYVSDKRSVIAFGDSDVNVYYSDFTFGDLRVRHTSRARVRVDALAIAHVHAYERASVHIDAEEGCKVTLFVHSADVRYTVNGDVKIRIEYGKEK